MDSPSNSKEEWNLDESVDLCPPAIQIRACSNFSVSLTKAPST